MAKRSSLTQEAKKCSWCSFYTNQSCCRYDEVLNNDAEFLNVQNRSFFSVSDIESIDMKIVDVAGETIKCEPVLPTRMQLQFVNI